jgi:phosphoglycolate phosphatase-like HAD superfamily hydrolase
MRMYLRSLGMTDAQIDEVHAAGLAKRREFERTTRPFPAVRETLARLSRQQITLGVVCSRSLTQRDVMNSLVALKLRQHFSLVTSHSEQSNMPRRQLTTSAARMGLNANQVAYVGCHDVPLRAAMDCGMLTFAFNVDHEVTVHHRLEQFDQLLNHLACSSPQLLAG